MPTEKINNLQMPFTPCTHPDHSPSKDTKFEPGKYKHTCPACGGVQVFIVPVMMLTKEENEIADALGADKENIRLVGKMDGPLDWLAASHQR